MDGSGGDVVVTYWDWSVPDQWDFGDFADVFNFSDYVLAQDQQIQALPEYVSLLIDSQTREALKVVADGVDGLNTIVKGIVQALKLAPGVPPAEIKRFEVLETTLEKGSVLIRTGAMSQENAKEFVKDGLELAFGQASDVALSLAVGYLTNHITQLMPGWGKVVPFAAIIATYVAANATDAVGVAVAGGIAEALFVGIDVVKSGLNWWNSSYETQFPDLSVTTDDLVLHLNPEWSYSTSPGYDPSATYVENQWGFYDLNGSGNPVFDQLEIIV
jgi:hypothetical protein